LLLLVSKTELADLVLATMEVQEVVEEADEHWLLPYLYH
jgi:hypothetical protein